MLCTACSPVQGLVVPHDFADAKVADALGIARKWTLTHLLLGGCNNGKVSSKVNELLAGVCEAS